MAPRIPIREPRAGGGKADATNLPLAGYLETLKIGQGRLAGERFKVLPWQRRFLRGAFKDGVGEAALSLGRGGGKSTLTAALACAALEGPIAQPESEVLVVASSHEQGQVVFRHVLRFLADKIERKEFRVSDTVNQSRITNKANGAMLAVKGSDPRRLHGSAPALTIADEVAQWPPAKIDEMLAALRTASGKIPNARLLLIGTRPADDSHPFAAALRDADYAQVHAAGLDDPPFQKRTWAKANPSLRWMPDLEKAIRREAKAAKRDPSMLAQFRALRLNLGVSDTAEATLLDAETWQSIEGNVERSGPCVWGVDLGTSASQSAIAAYWPTSGHLAAVGAFPPEPCLAERGLRDGVGGLYVASWKRGELIQCGGAAVSIPALLAEALARYGKPTAIAADRWREAELRDALQAAGVPIAALELRGMGFKDGAADVQEFRRACLEGKVTPEQSLLLRSAMSEARTVSDPAGNAKLAKGSENGRRRRARDDAAAAAILAVAAGARQPSQQALSWRYRGIAG